MKILFTIVTAILFTLSVSYLLVAGLVWGLAVLGLFEFTWLKVTAMWVVLFVLGSIFRGPRSVNG